MDARPIVCGERIEGTNAYCSRIYGHGGEHDDKFQLRSEARRAWTGLVVMAVITLAFAVGILLLHGCSDMSHNTHYGCPFTISDYRSATIGDAPSNCVIGDWWNPVGIDPFLDAELSR